MTRWFDPAIQNIDLGAANTTFDGSETTLISQGGSVREINLSSTTVGSANNLTGGGAGTLPYQSAAGTTAMLAAGTSGQLLKSGGAAPPVWATLLTTLTNSLSGDIPLNNVANYFDGPSVAQGTAGSWLATGTVTFTDTGGAANIDAKLWDGTTVIASGGQNVSTAGEIRSISLSGIITTPAGNLRISVRDLTAVTGKILFNDTTNSKDSTITVIRIG